MARHEIKFESGLGFHGELQTNVLVRAGRARVLAAAAAPSVTVTNATDALLPNVDVSLTQNQWDLTTFGFGFAIGFAVGHLPGAFAGGVGAWGWGRWRWRRVYGKKR